MELAPGTVLLGKYRVDEILGTGGMGRVVRASHQYLAQSVAIKILLPQMAESPSTVARFLREAQATVKLKNEHVARVIDVGTMPDGTPFMVMEYLEGNDLNQILRHHGPQPPAVVVDLMLQACEGMAEAHALGIIHRDIKPSNFFITRRPDGSMLLKILDFGISKTPVGFEELTGTQTVIGTPSYMPPEQMKSGKHADARSDIWSIGVVMYQLLQGRPPFQGESYAELVLKVGAEPPTPLHVPLPPGLGELIFKCLEKDPKARFQNVGELARMLAPFSSDPVVASQIASRTARILQHQSGAGGVQSLPIAAGGGLATPVPLSPAQLTPRSWPPSTSQSLGKGQQTVPVRQGRSWLVAGAFSLALLAAAGGYLASELMQKKSEPAASDTATVQMPPPTPTPAAAPAPATATPAPATATPTTPTPPTTPTTPATPTAADTATSPPAAAKVEAATAPASKDELPADSTWKPQAVQPTIVPKADAPTTAAKTAIAAKTATATPAKTETAPAKTVTTTAAPAKTETAPAKTVTTTAAPAKTETAPAKTTTKSVAKTTTKSVAKTTEKTGAKAPAKTTTKTPAKTTTKAPAKTPPAKKTDLFDSRK